MSAATPTPKAAPPSVPAKKPVVVEFATKELAHAHIDALRVEKLALEQYAAAAKGGGNLAGDSAAGHAARALGVQAEIDRLTKAYPQPKPAAK